MDERRTRSSSAFDPAEAKAWNRPPASYFEELLAGILESSFVKKVSLAGRLACESAEGDSKGREFISPCSRLIVMLRGSQRYSISHRGKRQELTVEPGDALYWASHAWQMEFWERDCVFLGIVYRRDTARFLLADHKAGDPPVAPDCHIHTPEPMPAAGSHLLACLDMLAETDPLNPASRELLSALLRLSGQHLKRSCEEDVANSKKGDAAKTWRRVADYLRENYPFDIGRDSVAEAFSMHPNYLSNLALAQSGGSFQAFLESLRMDEAKSLLAQSDLRLERIAKICGYKSASYFSTAFKRANGGSSPSAYRSASKT